MHNMFSDLFRRDRSKSIATKGDDDDDDDMMKVLSTVASNSRPSRDFIDDIFNTSRGCPRCTCETCQRVRRNCFEIPLLSAFSYMFGARR